MSDSNTPSVSPKFPVKFPGDEMCTVCPIEIVPSGAILIPSPIFTVPVFPALATGIIILVKLLAIAVKLEFIFRNAIFGVSALPE